MLMLQSSMFLIILLLLRHWIYSRSEWFWPVRLCEAQRDCLGTNCVKMRDFIDMFPLEKKLSCVSKHVEKTRFKETPDLWKTFWLLWKGFDALVRFFFFFSNVSIKMCMSSMEWRIHITRRDLESHVTSSLQVEFVSYVWTEKLEYFLD